LVADVRGASLTTTYVGGNGNRGIMFDISALNNILVTGFDTALQDSGTLEIYGKTGTHIGFETDSSAWTLLGSATVTSSGIGVPTPIPIPLNVMVAAGT